LFPYFLKILTLLSLVC